MFEDQKQECQMLEVGLSHEAELKRKGVLSRLCLEQENARFADTPGVSINNREQGFRPAFLDRSSGRCCISRFADGRPAPIHMLEGLPEDWVAERTAEGQAIRAHCHVVSGFLSNGLFYTREEVTRLILTQGGSMS